MISILPLTHPSPDRSSSSIEDHFPRSCWQPTFLAGLSPPTPWPLFFSSSWLFFGWRGLTQAVPTSSSAIVLPPLLFIPFCSAIGFELWEVHLHGSTVRLSCRIESSGCRESEEWCGVLRRSVFQLVSSKGNNSVPLNFEGLRTVEMTPLIDNTPANRGLHQVFYKMDYDNYFGGYVPNDLDVGETLQGLLLLCQDQDIQAIQQLDQSTHCIVSFQDIIDMLAFMLGLTDERNSLVCELLGNHMDSFKSEFLRIGTILAALAASPSPLPGLKEQEEEVEVASEIGFNPFLLPIGNDASYQSTISLNSLNMEDADNPFGGELDESSISNYSYRSQDAVVESVLSNPLLMDFYWRIVRALSCPQHSHTLLILHRAIEKAAPDDVENCIELGKVYMELGLLKVAIKEFAGINAMEKDYFEAYHYKGKCYKALNRVNEAVYCHKVAIYASKHNLKHPVIYQCHYDVGLLLTRQFKPYEALVYFKKCLDARSNHYYAPYQFAYAIYLTGDYRNSLAALLPYMKTFSAEGRIRPNILGLMYTLLGTLLRELGQPLENILKQLGLAMWCYNKDHAMFRPVEEIDEYTEMGDDNKQTRYVHLERGKAYLKFGQYDLALLDFQFSLDKSVGRPGWEGTDGCSEAYIYIAEIHFRKKDIPLLTECLYKIYAWYSLSETLYPYRQLRQLCLDIIDSKLYQNFQDEINFRLRNRVEMTVLKESYTSEIVPMLNKIVVAINRGLEIQTMFLVHSGHQLIDQQLYEASLLSFRLAKTCSPLKQQAQAFISKEYYHKFKKFPDHSLGRAHQNNSSDLHVLQLLVELFQMVQDESKMEDCYRTILKNFPERKEYRRKLSYLCLEGGKIQEGKKLMVDSFEVDPPNEYSYSLIRNLYRKELIKDQDPLFTTLSKLCRDSQSEKANQNDLLKLYFQLRLLSKAEQLLIAGPFAHTDIHQFSLQLFDYLLRMPISKTLQSYCKPIQQAQKLAEENWSIAVKLAETYERFRQPGLALLYYEKSFSKFSRREVLTKVCELSQKVGDLQTYKHYSIFQIDALWAKLLVEPDSSFLVEITLPDSSSRSTLIKRLCGLYKYSGIKSKPYVRALELAIAIKPLALSYLEDLIEVCLQTDNKESALKYILIYIENSPSKPYSYDMLLQIDQLNRPPSVQQQPQQTAQAIRDKYLGAILNSHPFTSIFFYYYFQLDDAALTEFRRLISRKEEKKKELGKKGQEEEKKNKKEEQKKNKQQLLKVVSNLKKAKNHYEQKSLLILMRGMLHGLNGNEKLAEQCYCEAITEKQGGSLCREEEVKWVHAFVQRVSCLSGPNQAMLLVFLLRSTTSDELKQSISESLNGIGKTEMQVAAV